MTRNRLAEKLFVVAPVGAQHAAPAPDLGNEEPENVILPADARDWQTFQTLAAQEGWRVPQSELDLHQSGGCSRSWALRSGQATLGLVTGVRHQHSAWIGNLIIAPSARGCGYGAALFDLAVRELRSAGARTLWLTASAQGAPLYAKRGFQKVGEVERWVRKAGGGGLRSTAEAAGDGASVDAEVWGEDRSELLRHLESTGSWHQHGASCALLQTGDDLQIIGPWYGSALPQDDTRLLIKLVAKASPHAELVIDLIAKSGRKELLSSAGFSLVGNTGLMVNGPTKVDWSRLLALATLGSCG